MGVSLAKGEALKNIVLAVYEISKRKKRMVKDALTNDMWISDINVAIISYLSEFTLLWARTRSFN